MTQCTLARRGNLHYTVMSSHVCKARVGFSKIGFYPQLVIDLLDAILTNLTSAVAIVVRASVWRLGRSWFDLRSGQTKVFIVETHCDGMSINLVSVKYDSGWCQMVWRSRVRTHATPRLISEQDVKQQQYMRRRRFWSGRIDLSPIGCPCLVDGRWFFPAVSARFLPPPSSTTIAIVH